jgi:hypothetical protein
MRSASSIKSYDFYQDLKPKIQDKPAFDNETDPSSTTIKKGQSKKRNSFPEKVFLVYELRLTFRTVCFLIQRLLLSTYYSEPTVEHKIVSTRNSK